MRTATQPYAVLGAGSWGTALAVVLARNGHPTCLWGHHPGHIDRLARERRNERYLPGIEFPPALDFHGRFLWDDTHLYAFCYLLRRH